jgi:1-acyl-sn-glycerol-3-phosphate acyltransferase
MKKERNLSVPNGLLYWLLYLPIKWLSRRHRRVLVHNHLAEPLQGPVVILANHLSYWDWAYLPQAFPKHRLTLIANRYYFRHPLMNLLLRGLKAIPKSMLYPDVEAIRKTMQAIRDRRYVLMFPEARLGTDGTSQTVTAGTGAFLKKLNVPLVFVEISGASLASPKWAKHPRRGIVEIDVKKRVEPHDYASMSNAELDAYVTANIRHDDFEYAARTGNVYRSPDLTAGLDGILYVCPRCASEFTLDASEHHITCRSCGFDAELREDMTFVSQAPEIKTIRAWNLRQYADEQARFEHGEFDFTVEVTVHRMDMKNPKRDTFGEGVVSVTREGIFFEGVIAGESERFGLTKRMLEGIPFRCDDEFEFYHRGFLHFFHPKDNPHVCAKVAIAGDVIRSHRGSDV